MYIKKYPYEGARLFGKVKKVTYVRIPTLSEFILLCRVQNFIKIPLYIRKELIVPFGRSNQSEIMNIYEIGTTVGTTYQRENKLCR